MRAPLMKNIIVNLDMKVSELINPLTKLWDSDALHHHFYQDDIDLIKKYQLVSDSEDYWSWKYTNSGEYSSKSGYNLALSIYRPEQIRVASSQPSLNALKNQVWKVKAPPKIKMFMWKALSSALPVADGIATRGIKITPLCQTCGLDGESINHVLFDCTLARQIWALSDTPFPRYGFSNHSIYQNIQYVINLMKRGEIPEHLRRSFPWILWMIWKNRNSLIFEGSYYTATNTLSKCFEDAELWYHAQIQPDQTFSHSPLRREKSRSQWKPPDRHQLKCNIGVSWNKEKRISGASWVTRNFNGEVLLHARNAFYNILSDMDAHLQAWLWTIECLKFLKIHHFILAGDSINLVSSATRPKAWPSFRFQSSQIIKSLAFTTSFSLEHENRKSNLGAYAIALSVSNEDRLRSYIAKGAPVWLADLFSNESRLSANDRPV